MSQHFFLVQSEWSGGLSGRGITKSLAWESLFSAPADLQGSGVGANPEELLGAAACGCLLITLAAVLQFQGIVGVEFRNQTQVAVTNEGGLKIQTLKHRITVKMPIGMSLDLKPKIIAAVERAEKVYMISQAIRSNVLVSVETEFESQT